MELKKAAIRILNQLSGFIELLSDEEYVQPLEVLNNSTVGQHIRHTLEFFICLKNGYSGGIINYDRRNHDKSIETDRIVALIKVKEIASFLEKNPVEKEIILELSYGETDNVESRISSNYLRELAYNIEHGVHHMAIIKIGARVLRPDLELPEDFGVAVSTLRYRKSQPQRTSA